MKCPLCNSSYVNEFVRKKSMKQSLKDKLNPFYDPTVVRPYIDYTICDACGSSTRVYFECDDCGAGWCSTCVRSLTSRIDFRNR